MNNKKKIRKQTTNKNILRSIGLGLKNANNQKMISKTREKTKSDEALMAAVGSLLSHQTLKVRVEANKALARLRVE